MRERLIRLLIPQIGWAIVSFLIIFPASFFAEHLKVSPKDFFTQLFTGSSPLDNPLWYQFDLIVLSVLLYMLRWLFEKLGGYSSRKYFPILLLLVVGAYAIQYTGINYLLCKRLGNELQYPFGRLAEMLPCAVMGLGIGESGLLGVGNLTLKEKYGMFPVIVFCGGMIGIIVLLNILNISAIGFTYCGLEYVAWGACFVVLFSNFSFNWISERLVFVIQKLGKYTLGIYCMHYIFGTILYGILDRITAPERIRNFDGCVFIYISCYVLCHIGAKVLPIGCWAKGMIE